MNKINFFLTLALCFMLISCGTDSKSKLSHWLDHKEVLLLSGINLKTKEPKVFNADNHEYVKPCPKTKVEKENQCGLLFPGKDEASQLVRDAITLTREKKTVEIIKGNGDKTKADIFIEVTAIYPGSHCTTKFLNGDEYYCCTSAGKTTCNPS